MNAKKGMIPPTLNAKVGEIFHDEDHGQFLITHSWQSLCMFFECPTELIFDGTFVFVGKPDENDPTTPLFLKRFFTSPILALPIDQVWVRISTGEIIVGFEQPSDVSALAMEVIRILTEYYEEMKRESRIVTISADEVHGKSREPYKGGIWGK